MVQMNRSTKEGCVEPYCFPDLRHSTGDASGSDAERLNAFQQTFSISVNQGTRSEPPGEVCRPPWGSLHLSKNPGSEEDSHPDAEAYRDIIDRLIQENEQQLKEVYAKGKEDGRQEGLKQGREQGKREGYDIGRREGYDTGKNEGILEAEARITPIADAFREAVDQLHALRKAALHEGRMEGVKLAFFIAERILQTQLRLHPELMQGIIEKACAMVTPSRILRMKLHPDAVNFCQNYPVLQTFLEDVVLIPDPSMVFGGCVVETDSGEIDARIESQLQVLLEALEKELELSRHCDSVESL